MYYRSFNFDSNSGIFDYILIFFFYLYYNNTYTLFHDKACSWGKITWDFD